MNVEIYESAKYPGGRCRSFYDKKTNIEIDNGNHLVFSANKHFKNFCEFVGSSKTLKEISPNFFFLTLNAILNGTWICLPDIQSF